MISRITYIILTTMVVNNAIAKLVDVGLSENEAKAYLALTSVNPTTAYEIAGLSGIPSSKIYGVLTRLQEKGVVSLADDDKKKRYVPISPEEFIESRRGKLERTLNSLKEDLVSVRTEKDVSYIWNIHDYEYLLEKSSRMILSAEHNILISGWHEELGGFDRLLKTREQENMPISIVHFGKVKTNVGQVFHHPIEDTIYAEKGGRGLVIIVDSKEAMIGTIFNDNRVEGAWSMNKGFVTLAEDYIKHDVYIMKIISRFDDLLKNSFGGRYEQLRDIFHDHELEKGE